MDAGHRHARGASEGGVVNITFRYVNPNGRRGGVRQGQVRIICEKQSRKPSARRGEGVFLVEFDREMA